MGGRGGGQGEPEHEARGTCWPAGTVQRGGRGGTVHTLPQKRQVGPWPIRQPVHTPGERTAGGCLGHLSLCVLPPHLKPSKRDFTLVQPKQTVPLGSKAPDKCQFCPQEAMVNGNLDVPQWGQGHRG